jgi:hypothetical protein
MRTQNHFKKGTLILIAFGLFACGGADKGSFTEQQICKATIAATMGRNPSIVKISSVQGNVTYLSYVRKSDNTQWKVRCKLEGNRVIWAADNGRWRTGQYDSKIIFSVNGSELKISEKYSDGSGDTKIFKIAQLGV